MFEEHVRQLSISEVLMWFYMKLWVHAEELCFSSRMLSSQCIYRNTANPELFGNESLMAPPLADPKTSFVIIEVKWHASPHKCIFASDGAMWLFPMPGEVRPSDCDLLGHMNNASYGTLFDDARHAAGITCAVHLASIVPWTTVDSHLQLRHMGFSPWESMNFNQLIGVGIEANEHAACNKNLSFQGPAAKPYTPKNFQELIRLATTIHPPIKDQASFCVFFLLYCVGIPVFLFSQLQA